MFVVDCDKAGLLSSSSLMLQKRAKEDYTINSQGLDLTSNMMKYSHHLQLQGS